MKEYQVYHRKQVWIVPHPVVAQGAVLPVSDDFDKAGIIKYVYVETSPRGEKIVWAKGIPC